MCRFLMSPKEKKIAKERQDDNDRCIQTNEANRITDLKEAAAQMANSETVWLGWERPKATKFNEFMY
jgi:hypothetical protein